MINISSILWEEGDLGLCATGPEGPGAPVVPRVTEPQGRGFKRRCAFLKEMERSRLLTLEQGLLVLATFA